MKYITSQGATLVAAAVALAFPPIAAAATERNVTVPTTSGITLSADVHRPSGPGPFPVLVTATPYSKSVHGPDADLVSHGYIHVVADVRGTGASGGKLDLFGPAETRDSVDLIRWAAQLPGSTGAVGMTGQSYMGITQLLAAGAIGPGSPLKAILPEISANDIYREIISAGGLLNAESSVGVLGLFSATPTLGSLIENPSGPDFGANLVAHLTGVAEFDTKMVTDFVTRRDRAYANRWWAERAPREALDAIVANGIPAYVVGGQYDVYQGGNPLNYSGLQNAWAGRPSRAPMSPGQPVTGRYRLLLKSRSHLNIDKGQPALAPIRRAWFDRWLKGVDNGIDQTSTPATVLQPGGQKLDFSHYPLPEAPHRRLHLGPRGTLTEAPPTAERAADRIIFTGISGPCSRSLDQWALGVFTFALEAAGGSNPCDEPGKLPESVRPAQRVYTSAPFERATTIAGPVTASLFLRSNTPDSEIVVKLYDVAPDGTPSQLTTGALLGSMRGTDAAQSWTAADGTAVMAWHPLTEASRRPLTPGTVTRQDVAVNPIFATLAPGHRLRVKILTGETPHLLPFPPDAAGLLGGIYGIERTAAHPSHVAVPLMPATGGM